MGVITLAITGHSTQKTQHGIETKRTSFGQRLRTTSQYPENPARD